MSGGLGPELQTAWDDAQLRGVGWVRIERAGADFVVERVDPARVAVLNLLSHRVETVAAALLDVPCATCQARRGEACVTPQGRPTTPHAARTAPLFAVYEAGRRDGRVVEIRRHLDDYDTPALVLLRRNGGEKA